MFRVMISQVKTRPSIHKWDESHVKSGTLEAAIGAKLKGKGKGKHLPSQTPCGIYSIYPSEPKSRLMVSRATFLIPCLFFLTYGATRR